ncbi:MAG TPA: hypothetical protein VFM81_01585 [Actinomycetota bacterium]|nr:hypothetical protein [Actinomycetota bacterium]
MEQDAAPTAVTGPSTRRSRRATRRRPSGEPPPLPKPAWWPRYVALFIITIVVGLLLGWWYDTSPPDAGLMRWFAEHRTDWLTDVAKAFSWLATQPAIVVIRVALFIVLVVFKRWRHIAVAVLGFFLMDMVVSRLSVPLPAPDDAVVTPGSGVYHFPAYAVASLSITLWAMVATLAPAGRPRDRAAGAAIALGVVVVLARAYLGTTYPIAGLYSLLLGFCIAATLLGWLAPDDSFPISYKRGGNAAHLDLAGARTDAVIRAMRDQLGIEVTSLKAFGDEGSGGSTPLLMTTADGTRIFGKILATSHVRADRWYRIGRTILYGRLEDETSFSSVRRLIAYEDYALRLLDDDGFTVAHSYGVVELTPNREYLLATQFFEGAETLGHAEVTDEVIDGGLQLVRRLWDSGLAHRDIKPANLLVVQGELQVIDVSGLEIRPSPWRAAVDLANMMLVLAVRTNPDRVYQRALAYFTPDEIGEAFAAAQGMAVPTELQRYLKEDGRDLIARFKELAPPHPKISIQRWSLRRTALIAAVLAGAIVVAIWGVDSFLDVLA